MIIGNDGKSGELGSVKPGRDVPAFFSPRFMDLLDSLLACLPLEDSAETQVLQIGIDSGDLAGRLLEDRMMSRLTVMDESEEALRLFMASLKHFGARIKTVCGTPQAFTHAETYHAVLSHLYLHEIERTENKTAVCRSVFNALKPGGLFAFTVVQPNPGRWISGSLREGEERDMFSRSTWNSPYAVPAEFWILWLEKIGFVKCRYFLQDSVFGVFKARKPFSTNA